MDPSAYLEYIVTNWQLILALLGIFTGVIVLFLIIRAIMWRRYLLRRDMVWLEITPPSTITTSAFSASIRWLQWLTEENRMKGLPRQKVHELGEQRLAKIHRGLRRNTSRNPDRSANRRSSRGQPSFLGNPHQS